MQCLHMALIAARRLRGFWRPFGAFPVPLAALSVLVMLAFLSGCTSSPATRIHIGGDLVLSTAVGAGCHATRGRTSNGQGVQAGSGAGSATGGSAQIEQGGELAMMLRSEVGCSPE